MTKKTNSQGFFLVVMLIILLVVVAIGLGGWYVWDKSQGEPVGQVDITTTQIENSKQHENEPGQKDEAVDWVSITTQGKAFSMKVPDGWKLTNYPADYLGSVDVVYQPGTPAVIEASDTEYAGHSLRFRASVTELDDAGLGPQWSSPQAGLEESTEVISIGTLQGKRYKGVFSQDLNQTLYEYIFNLGNNKKLDIVYTVDHSQSDRDDVVTVEKAIQTIRLIAQ